MQPFRYAAVGVLNTALDYGLFFALVAVSVPPWLANILSWTATFATAYPLNARYTFRADGMRLASLAKFAIVSVIGVGLGTATLVAVNWYTSVWIAKIAATAISFATTFLLHRHWTFVSRPRRLPGR